MVIYNVARKQKSVGTPALDGMFPTSKISN